eukprot:4729880-Pleurochrysis_carterae.AAC.2
MVRHGRRGAARAARQRRRDRNAGATRADGRHPPALEMPKWARGVVWNCADPADCRPVQRSARDTRFRGERQLNREALRAAAATLG